MLEATGAKSLDDLFDSLPEKLRLQGLLDLPPAMDEPALMRHLEAEAERSAGARMLSFLGAGSYGHHVPPAVDQILMRSEFLTAYTPYQPEVSQGTLQAIFEFQTIVARLFGLDVANASMYDGATAMAEACLMTRRVTGKNRLLVSAAVHPEYIEVLRTYLMGVDSGRPQVDLVPYDPSQGSMDLAALEKLSAGDAACVVAGYPNFFGVVEPLDRIAAIAGKTGFPLVTVTAEPYALGILKAPGSLGASIAVGEGQAVATTPSFGGPGVGLFAIRNERQLLRQIPGRLVGATVDADGERGFVLTLSTREQHIRREKATSNICSNQGLIALSAAIRLSLLGKTGFRRVSMLCLDKTEYLKKAVALVPGLSLRFSGPTFNEFAVRVKKGNAADLLKRLADQEILGGVDLGRFDPKMADSFLVAVTELHRKEDLDRLIAALREAV